MFDDCLEDVLYYENEGKLPKPNSHDLVFYILASTYRVNIAIELYHSDKEYMKIAKSLGIFRDDFPFLLPTERTIRRAMQYLFNGFEGNSNVQKYQGLISKFSLRSKEDHARIANKSGVGIRKNLTRESRLRLQEGNRRGGLMSALSRGRIPWTTPITVKIDGEDLVIPEIEYAHRLSLLPSYRQKSRVLTSKLVEHLNDVNGHGTRVNGPSFSNALSRYSDSLE